jgi:sugar lactone lactonase YvrE
MVFMYIMLIEFLLVPDMAAGNIYRLDAVTDRSTIVTQGEMRPTAVAYDPNVGKVFWTDVVANTLSSCHLDGSSKSVIYHFPYGQCYSVF